MDFGVSVTIFLVRDFNFIIFQKCLTLFQLFFPPSYLSLSLSLSLSLFVNPILHHTRDGAACSGQIVLQIMDDL